MEGEEVVRVNEEGMKGRGKMDPSLHGFVKDK